MADLKQALLATELDSKVITVKGRKVLIVEMSAAERDKIVKASQVNGKTDDDKFGVNIICSCARDPETRKKVFTPADIAKLQNRSWHILEEIGLAVLDINGLAPGQLEAMEKNSSKAIPAESSPSA